MRRGYYAGILVIGLGMMVWSAIMAPNLIAFIAGLLCGVGAVAFDRSLSGGGSKEES